MDLATVRRKANGAFTGFTRGQIAMLGIAVVATLAGIVVFLSWSSDAPYASLYSGLAAKDAAAVTQELTSRNVPYKLANGGASILVPEQDVYQLRIDLSAKGLPAGGATGWDLLDKQGLTTSDFRQRVDYQRALEGELAKTIGAIQGVQGATVHLVIPKTDIFTSDDRKPSASVLVATGDGVALGNQQVKAIVHLVASSVEGLTPEQVTVADDKGRVLAAPGEATTGGTDDRTDQTRTFESTLAKQLTTMLESITGPGKARVTVNASLDFDERKTTTERFPTDSSVPPPVVKETTSDESYQGQGTLTAGVLGPTVQQPQQDGTGQTTYSKKAADKTYAVGKVTEQYTTAPGTLKKLSVAVLLDDSAGVDVAQVQDLVRAAAGYDQARGDVVQVTSLPFDQSAAEQDAKALDDAKKAQAASSTDTNQLVTTGATVAILALVLFFAWRGARGPRRGRRRRDGAAALPAGPGDGGGRAALAAGEAAEALRSGDTIVIPQLASPAPSAEALQINDLIERQPEDVAKMLRTWLADRRS